MNTIKTTLLILAAVVLLVAGYAQVAKPTLTQQYEQSQLKQQFIAADKAAGYNK